MTQGGGEVEVKVDDGDSPFDATPFPVFKVVVPKNKPEETRNTDKAFGWLMEQWGTPSKRKWLIAQAVVILGFTFTSLITNIGNQQLFYEGAGGEGLSMLTVLPAYIGMTLIGFVPTSLFPEQFLLDSKPDIESTESVSPWIAPLVSYLLKPADSSSSSPSRFPFDVKLNTFILFLALIDVSGNSLMALGVYYGGSGIFQIISSTVVIFVALIAQVLLKQQIKLNQWIAIITATVGLGLSAQGAFSNSEDTSMLVGVCFSIASTMLYAINFVGSELLFRCRPVSPFSFCVKMGVFCGAFTLVYMAVYTFPSWDGMINQEVIEKGGSWLIIWLILALLVAGSFGNGVTYFILINEAGSLVTGVLMIAKSIVVFIASAVLFCDQHVEQCFTFSKALSSSVIIAGVVMFVIFSPAPAATITLPTSSSSSSSKFDEEDAEDERRNSSSSSSSSFVADTPKYDLGNEESSEDDEPSGYDLE